ncbi:BZ3500_MvSof-1268-A1-R1_Chr4-2g07108 [Microbotryum saponariae]|uniref:BZ3500_MvSof-1268-A1-R1_Chr4-2g07108 protein n=1 Tax=Microbotryum saponariae TaxID=289078 RepID=A0A2X0M437_9BASI|nr:BZ3500_MvSof-1268-A1-R1_Chr4-2g07108 [Microbotryum saponariae]SDA06773.1 BZ3501_MvSof-1269-A2-R1_Chr4-2g06819 [Microbotryum saponariae]
MTSWANSAAKSVSWSLNLMYSSGVAFSEISTDPLAPLASTTIVSLVDMSPSTEMELKERSTAYVSASCREAGVTAASVAIMPSSVACGGPMLGWIIPAPLSMPTILTSLPPSSKDRVGERIGRHESLCGIVRVPH